jgi:hypothetical protein
MKAELDFVTRKSAEYYDKKHCQEPELREGDRVYLLRRNIKTKRPSDKLDHKKLGPYRIVRVIKGVNFELALPKTMPIHPVFHISLLEPAPPGAPPAPRVEVEPDSNREYKIEKILDY